MAICSGTVHFRVKVDVQKERAIDHEGRAVTPITTNSLVDFSERVVIIDSGSE